MITVDWRDLGIPADEQPFTAGAVGELFHVPNAVASLPGRTLVFKQVKERLPTGLDPNQVLAQMRSVVGSRDGMSVDELADLDDVAVWPLAMVRREGREVGILIDLIADEFFVDARPATGSPGRVLFELQFLCASDGYFTKAGIDPSVTGDAVRRLAMSARLAYAIEVVHRRPVVFGDLHLKNAVAATRPFARVLLMDCDSVAELSDSGRLQLHGPWFVPPEILRKDQRLQDQATDVYKLGLCIIRALSPGKGATQAKDPVKTIAGLLDSEGINLVARAVSDDRGRRPAAGELTEYLVRRVRSLIQLPELLSAELSHRVVLRGSELFVRWQQRHGTEVRIFGANGFVREGLDASTYATGYAIRPPTAGPIDVEVWNQHGPSARIRAGYVDYYELPELDIAGQVRGLPRPVIPEVPALDADAFHAVEPYPVATHPNLRIEFASPTLTFPALTISVGRGPTAGRFDASPAAAFERVNRRASEIIDKGITEAMRRTTKALGDDDS